MDRYTIKQGFILSDENNRVFYSDDKNTRILESAHIARCLCRKNTKCPNPIELMIGLF